MATYGHIPFHTHLTLRLLFKNLIKSNLCFPYCPGGVALHWSRVNLQGHTPLNKLYSSSHSSYQLSTTPHVLVWLHTLLSFVWLKLVCCHSCCEFKCATALLCPCTHPLPLPPAVLLSLPQWFLILGRRRWNIDVLFMAEHSINFCSLYFEQLWISASITIYWRRKLLWWELKHALICG